MFGALYKCNLHATNGKKNWTGESSFILFIFFYLFRKCTAKCLQKLTQNLFLKCHWGAFLHIKIKTEWKCAYKWGARVVYIQPALTVVED